MAKEFMMVDNKKKVELAVIGAGVAVLLFLLLSNTTKSKAVKAPSGVQTYTASETVMAVFKKDSREGIKWGRDPFLLDSAGIKEQGMEDLVLNGVVSDKSNPYAIINNEIIKIGDKVNGMTVTEINENNVVLDDNGQPRTLELSMY